MPQLAAVFPQRGRIRGLLCLSSSSVELVQNSSFSFHDHLDRLHQAESGFCLVPGTRFDWQKVENANLLVASVIGSGQHGEQRSTKGVSRLVSAVTLLTPAGTSFRI